MSELFNNVERMQYTFNLNNVVQMCFKKAIDKEAMTSWELNDLEKGRLDNCVDKYLESFNLVKEVTKEQVEKIVNN